MSHSKFFSLVILIVILLIGSFSSIIAFKLPLSKKTIYLDSGHGGLDPGSTYKNLYEKDINLSISYYLQEELKKAGAKVYMTRYGDYDLSSNNVRKRKKSDLTNRAKVINKSSADLYISIHLNATKSSTWKGAQVFFDDIKTQNKIIAGYIQKQLNRDLKTNRSISEIKGMLFNKQVTVPGVLVEAGFISNPNDRYLLKQTKHQKKIAKSITKAIIKYYQYESY